MRVDLPIPPSANNLFVNARGRGRVKSREYTAWLAEAALALRGAEPVASPCSLEITIRGGKGFRRCRDLDNTVKAIQDALVSAGVLAGDDVRHVQKLRATYIEGKSQASCTVEVQAIEPA
jgi:crossover junction endodeoxyribonuclease RusA